MLKREEVIEHLKDVLFLLSMEEGNRDIEEEELVKWQLKVTERVVMKKLNKILEFLEK